MQQLDSSHPNQKRIRFKEYQCIFPGCNENPKTKYNCLSHIWDVHLRPLQNKTESFKTIQDKDDVKERCMHYVRFVTNAENRKRRPYDLSHCDITPPPT